MQDYPKWNLLSSKKAKNETEILDILFKSRNLYLKDKSVYEFTLTDIGINQKNFEKAFERLKVSKEKNEKIFIYGDYDADGICATASLWEILYSLGFNVLPFIPDRFTDGYGINEESVKRLINKNEDISLIITVDNGIVANKAIDYCNDQNIDVIVTDHHTKSKKVPKALSIIHTTQTSGSAIAWIFGQEIEKRITGKTSNSKKTIELACIGTVADQLPLKDFNRSLVKEGISSLKKTKRHGLVALFETASIDKNKLGTYEINYLIAPRINASGRLASGMDALRMLCTNDSLKSRRFAKNLHELNLERQDLVARLVDIAESQVTESKIIVVSSADFHEGVIGLIASRITEKYYRPTIALSINGEHAKASARSIKNFSIAELINDFREDLIEGGGHDMAGGFLIETEKIANFEKKINKHYNRFLTSDLLTKSLEIDLTLRIENINFSLLNSLEKLEPFGVGNRKPLFMIESATISNPKTLGKEAEHLKFQINGIDSIFFRKGELLRELSDEKKYDLVFSLERNIWNGKESLQIVVKDIRENNGKRFSRSNKRSKKILPKNK